jgi:hypothetical protein
MAAGEAWEVMVVSYTGLTLRSTAFLRERGAPLALALVAGAFRELM